MPQKYAVLIGCAEYPREEQLDNLRCPPNDVKGLKRVLLNKKIGGFDEVHDLLNVQRYEAEELVNSILQKASFDDNVLIYFSGHGRPNRKNKLHLLTSNSVIDNIEATSIPISTIKSFISASDARSIILILDCCYSGKAGEAFQKGGGLQEELELEFKNEGRGTYVMTASLGIELAEEKESEEYSVFTGPIIKGLENGDADLDQDGFITMSELYNYVFQEVKRDNQQTPTNISSGYGEIVLFRNPKIDNPNEVTDRSNFLNLISKARVTNKLIYEVLEFLDAKEQDAIYVKRHNLINHFLNKSISSESFIHGWEELLAQKVREPKGKVVKVLCIDGGFAATIFTGSLLSEIERRTKKPLHEIFQLISATSFSAILAMFLAAKNEKGEGRYDSDKFIQFVAERGPEIVNVSLKQKLTTLAGIAAPKYDARHLESSLMDYFGDLRMDSVNTEVLLTAYDIKYRRNFFFRSRMAKSKEMENFLIRDALRAATAAPTYFTPARIKSLQGSEFTLIDASMVVNNPSMASYVEINKTNPNQEYLLLSLGMFKNLRPLDKNSDKWGMMNWLNPLLEISSQGPSDSISYELSSILKDNFIRLDPEVPPSISPYFSDLSYQNIKAMLDYAASYIQENDQQLDEICQRLVM